MTVSSDIDFKPHSVSIFKRVYFSLLYFCPQHLIKTSEDLTLLRASNLTISWLTAMIMYYNTFMNISKLFTTPSISNLLRVTISIVMELSFNILLYIDLIYISFMVVIVLVSFLLTFGFMLCGMCLFATCHDCYHFISEPSNIEPSLPPIKETTLILPIKLSKRESSIQDWINQYQDPSVNQKYLNETYLFILMVWGAFNLFSIIINPFYFIIL